MHVSTKKDHSHVSKNNATTSTENAKVTVNLVGMIISTLRNLCHQNAHSSTRVLVREFMACYATLGWDWS